jgi:hypothetical protein
MANVKISALSALNTVDTTTQFAVISNTTGTNTTYRTSIANVTTAVLTSGNSNIRIAANANIGFSSNGTSNVFLVTGTGANVSGTFNATGNASANNLSIGNAVAFPGLIEDTTGNAPLLMFTSANGDVGWDSTIYYDHANETLNIGNLGISDTPAATGVAISTVGDTGAGTLFFNMNGNNVIQFTDDRRVKWALLTAANIPNPAAGSIIYNNDVGNAANGFYLCADGSGSASWDKIMAAKGNVVTLPGAASAPTAVAGGIYYNSTSKTFFMCANTSLGWQTVNLT